MAISRSLLTSGSGSPTGAVWTTASISPGANRLLVVTVVMAVVSGATGSNVITVTGNGLTYTRMVNGREYGSRRTMEVFSAWTGASPSAGAVTITSSSAGTEQNAVWIVDEYNGVDSGTPTGAVGTADAASGGVDPLNVTATGTADTGDYVHSSFATEDSGSGGSPDSPWTESADVNGAEVRGITAYNSSLDTSCSWDVPPSSAAMAIAFIINVASSATEFPQTVNAACAATVSVAKSAGKVVAVAKAATVAVVKTTGKIVSAACAGAVTVARPRTVVQTVAAACTTAVEALAIKVILLTVNVSATTTVTVTRAVTFLKTVGAVCATAVSVSKAVTKSTAVACASAVSLVAGRIYLQAVSAAVTATVSVGAVFEPFVAGVGGIIPWIRRRMRR